MNHTLPSKRLERLRKGFDLTIVRLCARKERKGQLVVVAGPDGRPRRVAASVAFARFKEKVSAN